jgi:hypothetical protein
MEKRDNVELAADLAAEIDWGNYFELASVNVLPAGPGNLSVRLPGVA